MVGGRIEGTWYHMMDGKGRLVLPPPVRARLGEPFVLTRAPDRALIALPIDAWERIASTRALDARFTTLYLAGCVERELTGDKFRLSVPSALRAHARIAGGSEVVIAGYGWGAHLMEAERWEAREPERAVEACGQLILDLGLDDLEY